LKRRINLPKALNGAIKKVRIKLKKNLKKIGMKNEIENK
jgi:hypothetical protein